MANGINTKSIINVLGSTTIKGESIVNIFTAFKIKENALSSVRFYEEYIVQSGDRWDNISYKF